MGRFGSARLAALPPYPFAGLDAAHRAYEASGVDVVNLSVGDPDLPTPDPIVQALATAAADPRHHRYPDYRGLPAFRSAVAGYYRRRYGVDLDPEREVLGLIGSKEGIAHLTWALAGPGDVVLLPDPAYPVYANQARLAGATVVPVPLAPPDWRPRWEAVEADAWRKARLLWLNYPHNPTGGVATVDCYVEAVAFCRRYGVVLASDMAYGELGLDGYRAPSALQVEGAREVAVELFSLSKPYRMTGWRVAAAVGSGEVLDCLAALKVHTDSGQFGAVQAAGCRALEPDLDGTVAEAAAVYARRRVSAVRALEAVGLQVMPARATFYVWAALPAGVRGSDWAAWLLREAGVLVTPGEAFGPGGEGYIRVSLTQPDSRLQEAWRRMARLAGRSAAG
jgi:LL-diaminopimelate aminotransferase